MIWTQAEDIQRILAFVEWRRKKENVHPTPGTSSVKGCEEAGCMGQLIDFDLVGTVEYTGRWTELRDNPQLVRLVLSTIESSVEYYRKKGEDDFEFKVNSPQAEQ